MPKMDGFEVCRRIKKDTKTANTKVIAISGYDTEENREKIFKCGADLFFSKPLDIKILKQEIGHILD